MTVTCSDVINLLCKAAIQAKSYWQFNYDAPLTKNTQSSTAGHRVSEIIKNVRITFDISETRLLDTMCDVKTEAKMMSNTSIRSGTGKKKISFEQEHRK